MLLSTEPTTKKEATAAFDGTFKIFYIFVGFNVILEKISNLVTMKSKTTCTKRYLFTLGIFIFISWKLFLMSVTRVGWNFQKCLKV